MAAKVPVRARKKRACALSKLAAWGVAKINSARSQMDTRAPYTVVGRNRRYRKGLEPSRRLSETTGPRHLSAFRIAFRRQR